MNTIKFIIFIIIGIILFFLFNKSEGFNIGVPWIIVNQDTSHNIYKLSGEPFLCRRFRVPPLNPIRRQGPQIAEDICYRTFSDAINDIAFPNDVVYHIIPDTESNHYRVDIEKCNNPHEKIMGTSEELTGEIVWKMKTKENNETKPLVPRKNLTLDHELSEKTEYNIDDEVTYRCEVRKTQNKTPHSLVCKSRKKFVVQAHGGVITEDYKTRIPQLFQVMLYKTDFDGCVRANYLERSLRRQAILKYDNSATDYKDVKIQGNKLYLARMENTTEYPQEIMEELVYSELSQLNSGHLYLNCNSSIMQTSFSDILYFKIGDYMYCFYTENNINGGGIKNAEELRANLVNFLNPYMLYGVFLLDNEDTSTTLDILNLKQFTDDRLKQIQSYNLYFPSDIYPNGVNSVDLHITEDEDARERFRNPLVIESLRSLGIYDPVKIGEISVAVNDMQNDRYPVGPREGIPGEQPLVQQPYFQDSNGNSKPVHFRKFRVEYTETLVDEITRQVRQLLLSCCVEIDPNLLRPSFRENHRNSFNRLFPNGLTRSFPLLYFDLYTIDGFIHYHRTIYSLDEQNGEYTSYDMRVLVMEIINQIYKGSKYDEIEDVRNLGYYQKFKTKMMLEKGYYEQQCMIELHRLYGEWEQIPPIFKQKLSFDFGNTFLCVDLLERVWGNYGYSYNNVYERKSLYQFSADVPIIFAKLFKTEVGEAADVHIMCCIREEDTNIRSIQKKGYWGCTDTQGYSEYTGPTTPQNTCEWYKTNSIARCNAHGHHGANDNCCICKMVKNMNEEGPINERPNVGPDCKVRECKETLEDKNRELGQRQPPMGISRDEWEKPNISDHTRIEGPLEGQDNSEKNRIMEHTETAFRYVSDTDDQEYGTIQLITDGNEEGVLKETPEITVLCNYTDHPIPSGTDYPQDTVLYTANDVAGQIKCNVAGDPDTDEAFYDDNLQCPISNACASVSINTEYFPLPSLEGTQEAIPPVLIGSGNGG